MNRFMSRKNKKVLIIGASGFIGKKLFSAGKSQKGIELFGTCFENRDKELVVLDVRSPKAVETVIRQVQPEVIIYAAGIANVDKAETDQELTDDLNANALRRIANFFRGHFIYLSTHYVFDGINPPYSGNDRRNPVNYYGQSKVKGEDLTKELFPKYSIIRLDTLYGYNDARDRETFVTDVIHALSVNKPLYLDNEMGRAPILIDEVAEYVFDLIKNECCGIYQLSARTSITKYEWAKLVAKEFGYDPGFIYPLQEQPEKPRPATKRAKDPRMVSSRPMSSVENGLKMMHKQMIAEVVRSFEDDLEYFDTEGNYLGKKRRSDIHRSGDWHMAVQAFIVRKGARGQLQVLSQHRRVVDIAKRKWDHSVAVQMLPEDKRDPLTAVRRGLKSELGIDAENIKPMHLVSDGIAMRSSRKYGDEIDDLYNREFVFVVIVELKNMTEIRPNTVKIDGVRWVDWEELVAAAIANPANYTKNLRHNFVNTALANHIQRFSEIILGIKNKKPEPGNRLIGSSYYSPPNNEDLVLSIFANEKFVVEHLTALGSIENQEIKNENRAVIDGLLKQPNLLPQYLYDKNIFSIDQKIIPTLNKKLT